MGFPTWTLWGMGLSALGALIAIGLALIGQSPRFLRRSGLSGYRLDLQVRAFTGYGFALLLLAFGFFLAGVPLGAVEPEAEVAGQPTSTSTPAAAGDPPLEETIGADEDAPATPTMPVTGAFGGPPPDTDPEPEVAAPTETIPPPTEDAAAATPSPTPTIAATPTLTATATPTVSPTPTLTPTPVEGRTAVFNGSPSGWVRRSPGGQSLVIVRQGDLLIVLDGRANQGGVLWQEVSALDGVAGWIQYNLLDFNQ